MVDSVADNASSARFSIGEPVAMQPGLDLSAVRVALLVDGAEVAAGFGSAVLGDPLTTLAWLARRLQQTGGALRAGEVVLLGAVHASLPLPRGRSIEARAAGLPGVAFRTV